MATTVYQYPPAPAPAAAVGGATAANQVLEIADLDAIKTATQTSATASSTQATAAKQDAQTADLDAIKTATQSTATNTTGVATAANQTTMQTSLSSIDTKLTSPLKVAGTEAAGASLATNPVAISGVDGSGLKRSLLTDSTGALIVVSSGGGGATSANQLTEITALQAIQVSAASVDTKTVLGQQSASASRAVTLSNEDVQDMYVVGQSAQTTTVNNILTTTSGSAATDLTGYRSASVQIISTGTGGSFIFEGSNDNVNFQTVPSYNQSLVTGVAIIAAITATTSSIGYILPVVFRYLRLRIATTITGGSIQAFSKFSQTSYAPGVVATTATLMSGTNTIGEVGLSSVVGLDQPSGAITIGTTTGSAKLMSNGASVSFTVNVTIASSLVYDFKVQESTDGATWTDIWQAPRITGVSAITSPSLRIRGIEYRYIEIASGTSGTRTITSARIPHAGELIRNIVDRTIVPTTTNSVSPSLYAEGASFITLTVAQGAGGSAVQFAIDGSPDGTNWIQGIKTITGIVSGYTSSSVSGSYKFLRARVVTGVASATINYIQLEAKETPIDTTSFSIGGSSSGTIVLTSASVTTIAAPVGAVGFTLQNDGLSSVALRYRLGGSVATTTSGLLLPPGQDTGYVTGAPSISLIAVSGTTLASYNLEWILK